MQAVWRCNFFHVDIQWWLQTIQEPNRVGRMLCPWSLDLCTRSSQKSLHFANRCASFSCTVCPSTRHQELTRLRQLHLRWNWPFPAAPYRHSSSVILKTTQFIVTTWCWAQISSMCLNSNSRTGGDRNWPLCCARTKQSHQRIFNTGE